MGPGHLRKKETTQLLGSASEFDGGHYSRKSRKTTLSPEIPSHFWLLGNNIILCLYYGEEVFGTLLSIKKKKLEGKEGTLIRSDPLSTSDWETYIECKKK